MNRIDDACAAAADALDGSGVRFALVAWLPGREDELTGVAMGSSNESGDAPAESREVVRACRTMIRAVANRESPETIPGEGHAPGDPVTFRYVAVQREEWT